jgi:hypothetical protein
MLHKVEPAEKGIPYAKNFYIRNISATNSGKAFDAAGLEQSQLANFVYDNCRITAVTLGTMEFTRDWKFNNMVYGSVKKPDPARTAGIEQQERLK